MAPQASHSALVALLLCAAVASASAQLSTRCTAVLTGLPPGIQATAGVTASTATTCTKVLTVAQIPATPPAGGNSFIKTLDVWTGAAGLVGVRLTTFSNAVTSFGTISGTPAGSVTLGYGETITALNLALNTGATAVGGISLTTSKGQSLTAGVLGTPVAQSVGSGIPVGAFAQTGAPGIVGLGFYFLVPFARTVLSNVLVQNTTTVAAALSQANMDRSKPRRLFYLDVTTCNPIPTDERIVFPAGTSQGCDVSVSQTVNQGRQFTITQTVGVDFNATLLRGFNYIVAGNYTVGFYLNRIEYPSTTSVFASNVQPVTLSSSVSTPAITTLPYVISSLATPIVFQQFPYTGQLEFQTSAGVLTGLKLNVSGVYAQSSYGSYVNGRPVDVPALCTQAVPNNAPNSTCTCQYSCRDPINLDAALTKPLPTLPNFPDVPAATGVTYNPAKTAITVGNRVRTAVLRGFKSIVTAANRCIHQTIRVNGGELRELSCRPTDNLEYYLQRYYVNPNTTTAIKSDVRITNVWGRCLTTSSVAVGTNVTVATCTTTAPASNTQRFVRQLVTGTTDTWQVRPFNQPATGGPLCLQVNTLPTGTTSTTRVQLAVCSDTATTQRFKFV